MKTSYLPAAIALALLSTSVSRAAIFIPSLNVGGETEFQDQSRGSIGDVGTGLNVDGTSGSAGNGILNIGDVVFGIIRFDGVTTGGGLDPFAPPGNNLVAVYSFQVDSYLSVVDSDSDSLPESARIGFKPTEASSPYSIQSLLGTDLEPGAGVSDWDEIGIALLENSSPPSPLSLTQTPNDQLIIDNITGNGTGYDLLLLAGFDSTKASDFDFYRLRVNPNYDDQTTSDAETNFAQFLSVAGIQGTTQGQTFAISTGGFSILYNDTPAVFGTVPSPGGVGSTQHDLALRQLTLQGTDTVWDYQDNGYVYVKATSIVPEPASTVIWIGLGSVLGVAGIRRRQSAAAC